MRDRFPWYFLEQADYEAAWVKATLTVDTNVILDLYRYNKSTREALLAALESFKGRFWISHQTAKEFVKNRRIVITDMRNDFDKAKKPVGEVEKALAVAIDAIRGCRVIPKELSEGFKSEIENACAKLCNGIDKEQTEIPDYESEDEIVKRIEAALDGRIGDQPEDTSDDLKEAQRRRTEKIPPGYMDDSKDGLGFAGDYLMWKQILSYSKDNKVPVILVTSETKEDWWEKKSGRTLNPRLELLKEAYETTGQRVLIYHTDQFLRLHQERTKGAFDETILQEIREYSLAREPAVSVSQEVSFSEKNSNAGKLKIVIARPVKNFTGTGRLDPVFSASPQVEARVVQCPEGTPEIRVRAATGTTFNFNVHVHSDERGKMLPVGEYFLEYEASCERQSEGAVGEDNAEQTEQI